MEDDANHEHNASRRLVHTRRSPVQRAGPIAMVQAPTPELQQLRITGVTGGVDARVYIGIGPYRACLSLYEAEALAAELRSTVRLARSFGTTRGARA